MEVKPDIKVIVEPENNSMTCKVLSVTASAGDFINTCYVKKDSSRYHWIIEDADGNPLHTTSPGGVGNSMGMEVQYAIDIVVDMTRQDLKDRSELVNYLGDLGQPFTMSVKGEK